VTFTFGRAARPGRSLWVAAALVAVLTTVGCSQISRVATGPDGADRLSFSYHRTTGPGSMDQTLHIVNSGSAGVIPTLEFTPLDSSGAALPGVTVSTAYGTDKGKVIVPAREISYDVLAFAGAGAADVRDVRVRVRAKTDVVFPVGPQLVTAQAVDASGQPTSKLGPFDAVVLTNPNADKVSVGLVCILWDQPPDGQSQQAQEVVPLGVATIPGEGTATIAATGDARNGCGSLKTFFSPAA
jgi:hypothetical protein